MASNTISTRTLIKAFEVNDIAVAFEAKSCEDILSDLGLHDKDGVMEYLICRLDATDLPKDDLADQVALYLDGIVAGVRASELVKRHSS